jgi:hypothetical protein
MRQQFFLTMFGVIVLTLAGSPEAARSSTDALAPDAKPGLYYAPFAHTVTLDGKLEDWKGVPRVMVRDGQKPGKDPADNGSIEFAVTADDQNLYFLAQAPDKNIIAGQKKDFWQEDSVEFYLNTTGNLRLERYQKGVVQLTVPAANIDVPVERAKFGGINGSNAEARALVFRTPDGYAMEVAVPLKNKTWQIIPQHGLTLGFEVQLNGSSGNTQDSVLNWKYRDGMTGHPSNTPSLFGKLVFYRIGETTMPDENVQAVVNAPQPGSVEQTTARYHRSDLQPSKNVAVQPPKTRDARTWPFSRDSIWNMPIGEGAQYVPSGLGPAAHAGLDPDLTFVSSETSTWRPLFRPGSWENRCGGALESEQRGAIRLEDAVFVADTTKDPFQTPNNSAEIVQPDGRTLVQLEPMARCEASGSVHGYRTTDADLYGAGLWGGHLGSGLSNGGTIRQGELLGEGPIRHALKVKLWGAKWLSYDRSSQTKGFRWPAIRSDFNAGNPQPGLGYGTLEPSKSKPNLEMVMGSLLAIPPNVSFESLGLKQNHKAFRLARKLFDALQNYGAYIDDDAFWDAHYFGAEYGVEDELRQVYNLKLSDPEVLEVWNALFTRLHVVKNNTPSSVGGGGTRRAPLAPDFEYVPPFPFIALPRAGWQVNAFSGEQTAAFAVDGKPDTAWRSGRTQARYQDVIVDLGAVRAFERLELVSGYWGGEDVSPLGARFHPRDFERRQDLEGCCGCGGRTSNHARVSATTRSLYSPDRVERSRRGMGHRGPEFVHQPTLR